MTSPRGCRVNFFERPPSTQWATLKYRGEKFAEVWFKPEDDTLALAFRILQRSFLDPGMGQQLTMENLLRAVGIARQDVDSWHHGDVSHAGMNGSNPDFSNPLPPPPHDDAEVHVYVRLKPPPPALACSETNELEISAVKWQDLEARWKVILGLEATMETLRISMESLRSEMEASSRKTLTTEEKVHALRLTWRNGPRQKTAFTTACRRSKSFCIVPPGARFTGKKAP